MHRWLASSLSEQRTQFELIEEPAQRVRLLVAYDGAAFSGFAINRNVTTVAGQLEAHLARVLREPITITGAGRTDKGVHAWGQVVSFDTRSKRLDIRRLQKSINSVLGPAIVVREATLEEPSFDARFSARWRRYRYSILRSATPNPFLASTTWHLPERLDVDAIAAAGAALVGYHDFSAFCRRPPSAPGMPERSLERTILGLDWSEQADDVLRMEITASAFCHQMVRSITGTLIDIGRGRIAAGEMPAILAGRDRSAAGSLAPPHGLCLYEVGYTPFDSTE